jgi:hypothetical protein
MKPIQDPKTGKRYVLEVGTLRANYASECDAANDCLSPDNYYTYISLWLQIHGEEV